MSLIDLFIRYIVHAAFLGVIILVSIPSDGYSQPMGHGRGNARVMDLSLQYDNSVNRVACLGDPDSLVVKPGDMLVLRARGTFVNNVMWGPDSVAFNKGKPSLANNNALESGSFDRGAAHAFKINNGITQRTTYHLKARCGNVPDTPPKIIVNP